jgi:ATPase subunit of ABC transporter with duplicated ATPase domains
MKCLKNNKTGNIIRVDDVQANNMVGSTWSYISKAEWKAATRTQTEQQTEEAEKKEETVSKKASRRAKLKAKQRPAELTDKILK